MVSSDALSDLGVILASLWYVIYPSVVVILGLLAKQIGLLRYLAGIGHFIPFLRVEFKPIERYVLRGLADEPTIGTLNAKITNMPRWKLLSSNAHNVQLQLNLRDTASRKEWKFPSIIWDLNTRETRINEMVIGREYPVRLLEYYQGSKSTHVMNPNQTPIKAGMYELELEVLCSEYKRPLRKKYYDPQTEGSVIRIPDRFAEAIG